MRVLAAHAVFAAILMASLAAGNQAAEAFVDSDTLEPAVLSAARSQGLVLREYETIAGTFLRTMVFDATGCSQPVLVSLRLGTFEEEPVQSAPKQGYVRRYIYAEHVWDAPDPRAFWFQRVKYRALAMFGLTKYSPSRYLLRVEASPHCQSANAVDWRRVWNRAYIIAAQTSAEAKAK